MVAVYQGEGYLKGEGLRDQRLFMKAIERNHHGVLSLKDIVDYYQRKEDAKFAPATVKDQIDQDMPAGEYFKDVDLGFSRNDLIKLQKANINDQKVYTPEAIERIIALKREFDDRGWEIKGFNVDYQTGAGLHAVVQTGAGNGQAQISLVNYNISRLGSGVINGTRFYHDKNTVWNFKDKTLRAPSASVKQLVSNLDFFLGVSDKEALISPSSNYSTQAVRLFDPNQRSRSRRKGDPSNYEKLMADFKEAKQKHPDFELSDLDGRNYNRACDGVMYIQKPWITANTNQLTTYQQPQMTEAPMSADDAAKLRFLEESEQVEQLKAAPKSLLSLIQLTYRRAQEDLDEDASFDNETLNRLPNVYDLIDPQTGLTRLELVDFDVVKRYADSDELLMRLLARELELYLDEGYSLNDFRRKMLNNASDIARQVANAEDKAFYQELLDERLNEATDESVNRQLDEEMTASKEVDRDQDTYMENGMDDDAEIESSSSANLSTRQYLLNMTPGMTYQSGPLKGQPYAGWLSDEAFTPWHQATIETARIAARQSGVKQFEARFDNDGVMHWKGMQHGQRIENKMGQFFFPATKEYVDPITQKTVPEGVIRVKRPGNPVDYRVNLYELYFVSPNDQTTRQRDGERSYYNDNIVSRMRLKGFAQSLKEEIARNIKVQALFGDDENTLYDSSRMRSIYTNRTHPIPVNAMQFPEAVRHLSNQLRMDNSLKGREDYLNLEEGSADGKQLPVKLQDIRQLMTQPQMAGIVSNVSSSDGSPYGLKLVLTDEFIDYLKEYGNDPAIDFATTGRVGYPGTDVKTSLNENEDRRRPLQRHFLDVSDEKKAELLERYPAHLTLESSDADFRAYYRSPMGYWLVENGFLDHDASDRQGQAINLVMNADKVLTKENAPLTAFMTLAGSGVEDGRTLSRSFAEKHGLMLEDKLSDLHNNKGTIGYVSNKDSEDPDYNKTIDEFYQAQHEAGIELDQVISPHSVITRHNMGVCREMLESIDKQQLIDPKTKEPLVDVNGHPIMAGRYPTIITPHHANKKNKFYGLLNNGKNRHISQQLNYALEANEALGVYQEFHGNKESRHLEFESYFNTVGFHTDPKTGALMLGYPKMTFKNYQFEDGLAIRVRQVEANSYSTVDQRDLTVAEGTILYPRQFTYLELPMTVPEPYREGESLKSAYLPILPAKYRRGSQSFDGEFREHDYTLQLDRIVRDSQQLEKLQMAYFETVLPEDLKKAFNVSTPEEVRALYDQKDPDFMVYKANYDYREVTPDFGPNKLADLHGYEQRLESDVNAYHYVITRDQFGVDHTSVKHSGLTRRLISDDVPDGATLVMSNCTSLDIGTVSISPLAALNAGLIEVTDKKARKDLAKAIAKQDVGLMKEAIIGTTPEGEKKYQITYDPQDPPRLLVWRDPVLHGSSMLGVDFSIDEERNGIGVHPGTLGGTGGDYDGDTLAVVCPKTEAAQRDLKQGKLSYEYKLRSFRQEEYIDPADGKVRWRSLRNTIDGVDIAVNFAQSEEGKELQALYPEDNAKKLVGHYLDRLEEKASSEQYYAQGKLFERQGYDQNDLSRYFELASLRESRRLSDITPDEKTLLEIGDQVCEYAQYIGNVRFAEYYNNFAQRFIADKNQEFKPRALDFTNEQAVLDSIDRMIEAGEKGKAADRVMNESYMLNKVGTADKVQQNIALGAKVDKVGQGGARLKDSAAAVQSLEPVNHVQFKAAQILDENSEPTGEIVYVPLIQRLSPMETVMDLTEGGTQAVLSIKKNAAEVPIAERYLSTFNRFINGPSGEMGPTQANFIEFDNEALKDISFVKLVPNNNQHWLTPEERQSMLRTAERIDQYIQDNPDGTLCLDINNGIVSSDRRKNHANVWLEAHSHDVYALGLMANAQVMGLDVDYREARTVYNVTRSTGDYTQPSGYQLPIEEVVFNNARPYEYMAQRGIEGVAKLATYNYENQDHPERLKTFQIEHDEWANTIASKDYEKVTDTLLKDAQKVSVEFPQQRQALEDHLNSLLVVQKSAEVTQYQELAKTLDLPCPSMDLFKGFNGLQEVLKDNDPILTRERTEQTIALNREENGVEHYRDVADTMPGRGGDGPQMDPVNQERADKLIIQPAMGHGDVADTVSRGGDEGFDLDF